MKYKLAQDTRIMFSADSIHIRRGVWNIESGQIHLSSIPESSRDNFIAILRLLQQDKEIDFKELEHLDSRVRDIFLQCEQSNFIVNTDSDYIFDFYNLYQKVSLPSDVEKRNKFFIIRDICITDGYLEDMLSKNSMQAIFPTEEERIELDKIHSVDMVDTILYQKSLDHMQKITKGLPVVILQENLNLSLARIMNRSLNVDTPMFLGFIDGPFLIYISVLQGFSACFECFENSLLARLKDHQLYYQFAEVPFIHNQTKSPLSMAAMSFLMHQAFSDIWSFYITGKSQFCGKVLQIYLPTFEIQYQDILRNPICPSCGYLTSKYTPATDISLSGILNKKMKG